MGYTYSLDSTESPSEGVVTAMAEYANCSPLELKPLGNAIDPEKLDSVLGASSSVEVTFQCCRAMFTVTEDDVHIEQTTEKETC